VSCSSCGQRVLLLFFRVIIQGLSSSLGGSSDTPALCAALTGTVCSHARPAARRRGTGGRAERDSSRDRRFGDATKKSPPPPLVICIVMQTGGFYKRCFALCKVSVVHTVVPRQTLGVLDGRRARGVPAVGTGRRMWRAARNVKTEESLPAQPQR